MSSDRPIGETNLHRSNHSIFVIETNADVSTNVERPNGHGIGKRWHLGPRVFDSKKSHAVDEGWRLDESIEFVVIRVECSGLGLERKIRSGLVVDPCHLHCCCVVALSVVC